MIPPTGNLGVDRICCWCPPTVRRASSGGVIPELRIETDDGVVLLQEDAGKTKLTATANSLDTFINRRAFATSYPRPLIEKNLSIKGIGCVCDEIARNEDPRYVAFDFETGIFAFVPKEAFAPKRPLDFGCGGGASTMNLRRMLPQTKIVGVVSRIPCSQLRKHPPNTTVTMIFRLVQSPSGTELPHDIG